MSDIVERLREESATRDDPLLTDAAGEIEKLRKALAAQRDAILELIESYRRDGHLYDADYVLQAIAAEIRARGEKS
jgi:hypothetical protein